MKVNPVVSLLLFLHLTCAAAADQPFSPATGFFFILGLELYAPHATSIETQDVSGVVFGVGSRGQWGALEGFFALASSSEVGPELFEVIVAAIDGKLFLLYEGRVQPFMLVGFGQGDISGPSGETFGPAGRMGLGANLFLTRRLFLSAQMVYLWKPGAEAFRLLPEDSENELAFGALTGSLRLNYTVTGMSGDPTRKRLFQ
jgi:hypothetical protein